MAVCKKALVNQVLAFFPISALSFTVGCAYGYLPLALYYVSWDNGNEDDIQLTDEQCALVGSLQHVGRFVVAVPAGLLAEKVGRKAVSLTAGTIFFVTWPSLYLTSSIELIFLLNLSLGIAVGMVNALHQMYVAELVSADVRGTFSSLIVFTANLGSLTESLVGMYTSYKGMVLTASVVSVLYFVSAFWLVESPYFLLSVDRQDEAKDILRWLREGNPTQHVETEFFKMKEAVNNAKISGNGKNLLALVRVKDNLKCLYALLLINFTAMFTGVMIVKLYCAFIFSIADDDNNNSYNPIANPSTYPFLFSLVEITCSFLTPLYIDKFRRRILFYVCTFGIALSQLLTASMFYLRENYRNGNSIYVGYALLVCVLCSTIAFNICLNPLIGILRGELLPQSIRGAGAGLAVVAQSCSLFLATLMFQAVRVWIGISANFLIFAAAALTMPIIVYTLLPETKGKTLAEIQDSLNSR